MAPDNGRPAQGETGSTTFHGSDSFESPESPESSDSSDGSRLALGETAWWIWEHFPVRSAGFPLADLTAAAVPADDTSEADADTAVLRRTVDLARADRFTRALLWQNPAIVANVVTPLVRHLESATPPATKKDRRRLRDRERTLARYLQRYYTRNESIGFFGPVSWGRLDPAQPEALALAPGPELIDQDRVWFEDWAIDRLAVQYAADEAIRRHLPPAPALGTERLGRTVLRLGGTPYRLDATEAAVLALADGRRAPADLAAATGTDTETVLKVLTQLAAEGVLTWGIPIPMDPHAEQFLAARLRDLPDSPEVRAALADVDALVAARDRVAETGDAAGLAAALADADRTFQALTEDEARRSVTDVERGRRLLVGQSHRDVAVTVGPAMLAELAPPLAPVLAAARWFCGAIGDLAMEVLAEAHARLAPKYGPDAVPLDALITAGLLGFVLDAANAAPAAEELAARWTRTLGLTPGTRRVVLHAADLAGPVAEAFAAPVPGWYSGRHHSPDVMIAADGAEAVARGEYEFVLGEVHAGIITCDGTAFNAFAPAPEAILRPSEAALADGPERFVPLYLRGFGQLTARHYPNPETFSEHYRYLSFGGGAAERGTPAGRRVAMAEVVVGPDLVAAFPDRSRHPVLAVVGELLAFLTFPNFSLTPGAWAHVPRVTVDRLVVTRETWRVGVGELAAGVDAVAQERGMPRHMFWRAGPGLKPLYLDLHSPMLVRLLGDAVRRADDAAVFSFTEMLPGPDQLWLTDAEGRRYTSELRLTVAERVADQAAAAQAGEAR